MYAKYFGLKEKPFAIAPDPRYLYMSKLHQEAFAHLRYGVSSDGCLILLTGDVGTGKTTVSRCLIEQLPEKTDIALILNPKLSITELLKTICEELNIPVPENPSSDKRLIDKLNSYLLKAHAGGRTTALLIDEAQNLDIKVLEQLRLLTNLETNTHKLLQIMLLGQPELRDMLESPQLTQINQRITSRYHLQPLSPDDIKKYIRHRINIAGGSDSALFSPRAINHIIKFSKGIPRIINVLCDRGLLGAYAENKDRVDLRIIKKAAREISAKTDRPFFAPKKMTVGLLLLLFGVCIFGGFYFLNQASLPLQPPQPKALQSTILKSPAPEEPGQSTLKSVLQRVIIINPVKQSDADLTEDIENAQEPPQTAPPLNEKESSSDAAENDRNDSDQIGTVKTE